MLYKDLVKHANALTDGQRAAFVSFAFNVRNKAFCRSTLVRKTNPGDIDGVCAELSRWTNAARLGGSWVLNGWRAGVRIACAESFHSKQVQAQTPKAQAATEIKWQQCRITFSLNRKNTHDDTKRLAALESGRAADAARIAGLRRYIRASATQCATVTPLSTEILQISTSDLQPFLKKAQSCLVNLAVCSKSEMPK